MHGRSTDFEWLGTFDACAVATSLDSAGVDIGDAWPFDDTVCQRMFGVRRVTVPFRDPSNYYTRISDYSSLPDQTLWVSMGADVVDGEFATWDPPPPRASDTNLFGPTKWFPRSCDWIDSISMEFPIQSHCRGYARKFPN